jgi:exonuclease SbcC
MRFKYSTWSKWDLHVHTPFSIVHEYKSDKNENIWEKYIKEIEKLKYIKVLGINDYWFIDGYKKVLEYKKNGKLKNINLILPVIELRLEHLVGNDKTNKINYHIIFSNELKPEEIEEEFIKKIEIKNFENRSLTKENLIKYGKKILSETPKEKRNSSSPLQLGFNNFAVDLNKIKNLLKKSLFKDKYLIAIGKNEWEDFRWDGSADIKKSLINEADIIFVSSPTIENFKNSKKKLLDANVNDLLIHTSDAHKFSNSDQTTSKELGHCFTWIKAKPTFEGLKQVIYESKYRLKISEEKLFEPISYIKSVDINFRENIRFKDTGFCFSRVKETIYFSPNFTCIIGGRGSGKSTLLNLIAKKLDVLNDDFFEDLNINEKELLESIKIDPDVLSNVEYLAQNTIEKFATDSIAFSKAIFKRINKLSENKLEEIEKNISNDLKLFDEYIMKLKKRSEIHKKLNELKNTLKNYKNIIEILSDKEYINKKDQLSSIKKEFAQISNSLERVCSFLEIVEISLTKDPFNILSSSIFTGREKYECFDIDKNNLNLIEENNEFDKIYNNLLINIYEIYTKVFESEEYKKGIKKLNYLKENSEKLKKEIYNYLREKGIEEESILDIQEANENFEKLKIEIDNIKKEIKNLKRDIKNFSFNKIDDSIKNFENIINDKLKKFNETLKKIANENREIKTIEIKFTYLNDIFEKVFDEFEQILNLKKEIKGYRETFKNYLKEIEIDEILRLNYNELIKKIEKNHSDTKTFQKIKQIFNKTNFLIFQALILKYKKDVKNNKRFNVYYDNKNIANSSFGQKCTTVILIMLLLGNNPIIMDEPEAHLDSSLIANYLVDLIKKVKQRRQIIFATHNANFVINGDAELIIKLENIDGKTTFKFFSIEDIEYRKDLLQLEGGEEAFKKREYKYGI